MTRIGIIGADNIGGNIARLCVPKTLSRLLTWCLVLDEGRSG
jgi:hypothetical protein